jgi:hypothetical protein
MSSSTTKTFAAVKMMRDAGDVIGAKMAKRCSRRAARVSAFHSRVLATSRSRVSADR